jgi:hypothetical protein
MRLRLRRFYKRIRRRASALGQEFQVIPLMLLALFFLSLSLSGYYLLSQDSGFDHALARSLLNLGLPAYGGAQPDYHSLDMHLFLYWLTNYDLRDPLHMVEAALPFSPQVVAHMRVWDSKARSVRMLYLSKSRSSLVSFGMVSPPISVRLT